jgi:hypothetical protein
MAEVLTAIGAHPLHGMHACRLIASCKRSPGPHGAPCRSLLSSSSTPAWPCAPTDAPCSPPHPQLFGVDLAVLTTNAGKELIFSEFGCGGGASVSGETPARSVSEAIATPYYGVFGAYTRRLDPWDNHLPRERVISATQQLLRKWYGTVMLWLQRKGGPTYRVDHVFIWNLNSW